MKSKYFNISENADGTFNIRSITGRTIEKRAASYDINPKQPKYIKVGHDKGTWCSLYSYRGYALKDTMWVDDVVLNDDGSYRVKEYMHSKEWKNYDAPHTFLWGFKRCALMVSSAGALGALFFICVGEYSHSSEKNGIPTKSVSEHNPVRVSRAKADINLSQHQERVKE